ncbi:MAG: cupin domain-containing protein [Chloroflexi bacterium]|nr:MAG: cupin domain-containing protein [Chloroflexota bacterium]
MNEPRFLIDPYKDWVAKEGIPVHEGFGLDLLDLDVAPWPRLEANGAFAHLTGRGDFIDMQIVEIPPGGKTAPQRHLYEEVVYVLAGRGSTSVESPSGERHSFEWHTGSLFAIPLNGSYRHYNGSGTEPARIVAVTDLFVLADGTMHAHMSEMPVGTYKKGHRHGADFHVFAVTGEGYSLYWWEGETELRRFDWKHGCVFAPADRLFHQHFNVSAEPARYLAIAFGGLRYPTLADKRATFMGMDVSVKEGGRQIEYEDEDPRIRRIYEDELRKRGIPSRMDAVFQPA